LGAEFVGIMASRIDHDNLHPRCGEAKLCGRGVKASANAGARKSGLKCVNKFNFDVFSGRFCPFLASFCTKSSAYGCGNLST
jgi:hypothetical protein